MTEGARRSRCVRASGEAVAPIDWSVSQGWGLQPGRVTACLLRPLAPHPLQVFEAAPQEARGVPSKKAAPDYFL